MRNRSRSSTVTVDASLLGKFPEGPRMLSGGVARRSCIFLPRMINTEEGSSLAQAAQMRDISLHDKCRAWLNQKKQQTLSYLQLPTPMFLFKAAQISIWHERERKEANICGLEMEIKSLLLVFILVPPSPAFPCLFLALRISLPHFRMGVHGWMNGLVSCKATAKKMRSFLPELDYTALFFSNGRLSVHLSGWSNTVWTCEPLCLWSSCWKTHWKLANNLHKLIIYNRSERWI